MLKGYKTYIAAVGMFALGVYQLTQGNFELGAQSVLGALGMFGLRSAWPDVPVEE